MCLTKPHTLKLIYASKCDKHNITSVWDLSRRLVRKSETRLGETRYRGQVHEGVVTIATTCEIRPPTKSKLLLIVFLKEGKEIYVLLLYRWYKLYVGYSKSLEEYKMIHAFLPPMFIKIDFDLFITRNNNWKLVWQVYWNLVGGSQAGNSLCGMHILSVDIYQYFH